MPFSVEAIAILKKGLSTGKYPIRWITYKQRIQEDVVSALAKPGGKEFLNLDYCKRLANSANSMESWEIRLLAIQFAISIFIVLGYVSSDPSLTLLGVSLKNATGLKEVLLAATATLGVAIQIISAAKQTKMMVVEAVSKGTTPSAFLDFADLAAPTPFQLRAYFAKQYNCWLFPTIATRALFAIVATLVAVCVMGILLFSIFASIYVYIDVYRNPAMGSISYMVLGYSGLVFLMVVVWALALQLPLPFRDGQLLKRLTELEKLDKANHALVIRKLAE